MTQSNTTNGVEVYGVSSQAKETTSTTTLMCAGLQVINELNGEEESISPATLQTLIKVHRFILDEVVSRLNLSGKRSLMLELQKLELILVSMIGE